MAAFGRFSSERVTTLFHFLALSHKQNTVYFLFGFKREVFVFSSPNFDPLWCSSTGKLNFLSALKHLRKSKKQSQL